MFGSLFDETSLEVLPVGPNTSPVRLNNCVSNVLDRRGATQLCGLENLGATCYLNSLIQTLLLTPELREGLMALDLEPLEGTGADNVRVIPLQLQKLFAQLLLYDVASISTNALTESFGWTDHEELYQQQDVQELIRILFYAIQKSLVGTPGHDLISRLYQGETVSKVECQNCHFISEREESYLDLTVAVGQNKTLKSSLYDAYCEVESMTGRNQYLCPTCQNHTDANRVVKIRQLPPILTLSLLRFLYDPVKQQRFKDESRLEFPLELDMSPFCEESLPSEVTTYELLSVIVHRGGAHGGHYHAIIRDVDNIGHWDLASKNVNVNRDTNVRPPELLIRDVLQNAPDSTLTLEQLLDKVLEYTGVTWSKSYKSSYGTIAQFLNSRCSYFFVDGNNDLTATVTMICDPVEPKKIDNVDVQSELSLSQKTGRQWFNFNDMEVTPVHEEDIENFFEGEESAYMLVYRRKSLKRPEEAFGNPAYGIPDSYQNSMARLNAQAEADREQSHLIWVRILPRSSYTICQRSLYPSDSKILEIELTIDERETLSTLKRKALEMCSVQLCHMVEWHTLHTVQQTNYSLTIQDIVPDSDSVSLEEFKVENGAAFLAWSCDVDLDAYDSNNIDYAWEEQVECQPFQPMQHCAVVFDNQDNQISIDDARNKELFSITLQHTVDGKQIHMMVNYGMTVMELRNSVVWQMACPAPRDSVCLRLGEDVHSLEPPLYDHLSLLDACIKPECTVYVDPRVMGPIQPNQIWLSFTVDDSNCNHDTMSVVMDSDDTVACLVDVMLKQAAVDMDEAWHIAATNFQGDVIKALNNPHATLSQEKLHHGTHLVLRRGSLLPKGIARIKLLLKDPPANENQISCPSKAPHMPLFYQFDVDAETTTLHSLKCQITTLIEDTRQQHFDEANIRVRFFSKATSRPGRVLKDDFASLKSMDINKNATLVIELLAHKEHLKSSDRVLQVWCHEPEGFQYRGPQDLVWDHQATSLAEAVSRLTGIGQDNLVVARYHPRSQKWALLNVHDDESMIMDDEEKENFQLLQPDSLNDGDILLVKDASLEKGNLKDFTTTSALETWIAEQEAQDAQQRSNEEAAAAALEWTAAQAQSRLPERGIHIHVSDFC